jgi:hypothetical protein
MTNIELATTLVTHPSKALAELDAQPRVWFPLVLTLVATVGITIWYYTFVDFSWFVDQTLSDPGSARMTDAQRQQAAAFISRGVLMGTSVVSVAIFLLGARVAEAVYYLIAGNLTGVQKPFKNWFALGWWTGLPGVISAVAAALTLLLSDTHQIASSAIAPLSLNELFFHKEMTERGFTLLTTLTLIHPIIWSLTVVGVRVWSGRSWLFSALFALIPPFFVYGTWAALSLR